MSTPLAPAAADATYLKMCAAREAGEHTAARLLATTLRDSIVDGGPIPAYGPVGHVGNAIIAAMAPECARCGQPMIMAGGLWTCGH
jgi:hypothetical protein